MPPGGPGLPLQPPGRGADLDQQAVELLSQEGGQSGAERPGGGQPGGGQPGGEQTGPVVVSEDGSAAFAAIPVTSTSATDNIDKVEALRETCDRLGIPSWEVLAVGDGANDLGMLAAAGTGVALHAKPVVQARCHLRINHGDLTALLFLQGFTRDEFHA